MATPEFRRVLKAARVPPTHITAFTRQMSALLSGGVPLVQALGALREQPECPPLGSMVEDIGATIASGSRLSAALAHYPKTFGKLYVTMAQVGENSGELEQSLERLAEWLEKDDSLRQKVKSALTYPMLVLSLAAVLTLIMFYTVLPGFVSIFEEMQTPLPLITQIVVWITKCVRNPICWGLGALGLWAAWAAWKAILANGNDYARFFQAAIKVPGLGGLLFHGTCARYCSALEVLLSAGMDSRRSFLLAGAASGSPLLEQDSQLLVQSVLEGIQISAYLAENPLIYSSTIIHLAVAGDEASRLPEMFKRAAYFHELEMQAKIDAVSVALEPILLSGVALVVGTVLVAIFLPLYSILATFS